MVDRDVQSVWLVTPDPFLVHLSRPNLTRKHPPGIIGYLMIEHHPGCSCQFPGNGPDGDNAIRFGLFSFIETLRQWLKTYRKIRCLREIPGEIFVAGFGVALAFLFAIAGGLAVNTTAV